MLLGDDLQAGTQVRGGGALPHQNMQAGAQLGQGLLLVGALMVAGNARAHIGVQGLTHDGGGMALGGLVVLLGQLQHVGGGGRTGQDGGCQHLRQAHGLRHLDQLVDHLGVQGATGGLKTVFLHEGRHGVVELHRGVLGLLHDLLHALHAGDDGDLHQVGSHGSGAVLDHHLGKFGVGEHAALDVDMGVHEAGGQVHALGVDHLRVGAHGTGRNRAGRGNLAVGNGNLRFIDLVGDDVDQLAVLDHDVRRLLPQCYLNQFVVHLMFPFLFFTQFTGLPGSRTCPHRRDRRFCFSWCLRQTQEPRWSIYKVSYPSPGRQWKFSIPKH